MTKKISRFVVEKRTPIGMFTKKYTDKPLSFKFYWSLISLSRNNRYLRSIIAYLSYLFYKIFRNDKHFVFNGRTYKYFYHLYNRTVASERIVEIPIAKYYLDKYKKKRILEVGNVLSHYFRITHDVLDKYEKGNNVINEDVVDFKLNKMFDLIISVSTMEHVGFSYGEDLNPEKFTKGIANLKKYLKSKGVMLITFPLFYNEYITRLISTKKSPFTKQFFMARKSFMNEWEQITQEEALKGKNYDSYYANSNILCVGVFNKK